MNRTSKLLLGLFVLVVLSCNALTRGLPISDRPTSNPISPIEPTIPSNKETPTLASPTTRPTSNPQSNSNTGVALVPFNYTLKDLGDGWNQGQISIAIENPTDAPIVVREIKLGKIVIETMEGVTYVGELSSSDFGRNLDRIRLYQDTVIPPHFRWAVDGGANELHWLLTWKSATAATPSKITFSEQSQLSVDIPLKQGEPITFPFEYVNSPQIDSISSLSQESLGIFNDNITATFTGKCWNYLDLAPNPNNTQNVYFIEFVAQNMDQFNQQITVVNNPMSFFFEDGRFAQRFEAAILWVVNNNFNRWGYETEIVLGPGQTQTGYMLATGYSASAWGYPPPIIILWDADSYRVFDTTGC